MGGWAGGGGGGGVGRGATSTRSILYLGDRFCDLLHVCLPAHQAASEKGFHLLFKREEFAPKFSTRVDPFSEGSNNNFDSVTSLESV